MPFTTWIRDLFGIRKDAIDIKKTKLEIEIIEELKREKLITPATLDDVKKYDPKTAELLRILPPLGSPPLWPMVVVVILLEAFVAWLIVHYVYSWLRG